MPCILGIPFHPYMIAAVCTQILAEKELCFLFLMAAHTLATYIQDGPEAPTFAELPTPLGLTWDIYNCLPELLS